MCERLKIGLLKRIFFSSLRIIFQKFCIVFQNLNAILGVKAKSVIQRLSFSQNEFNGLWSFWRPHARVLVYVLNFINFKHI